MLYHYKSTKLPKTFYRLFQICSKKRTKFLFEISFIFIIYFWMKNQYNWTVKVSTCIYTILLPSERVRMSVLQINYINNLKKLMYSK